MCIQICDFLFAQAEHTTSSEVSPGYAKHKPLTYCHELYSRSGGGYGIIISTFLFMNRIEKKWLCNQ